MITRQFYCTFLQVFVENMGEKIMSLKNDYDGILSIK